jgi:hypothetical protein
MQPRALVLGGNARQSVRSFKGELFHKLDNHVLSKIACGRNNRQIGC